MGDEHRADPETPPRARGLDSHRRRIFSEHVPMERLQEPRLLEALLSRGIELLAAVRPGGETGAASLVSACRETGVRVGLWPMLSDAEGRWASSRNAGAFARFVERLLASGRASDATPDVLVIDLEPPIREVRRLLQRDPRVALRWVARARTATSDAPSLAALADVVTEARAHGIETFATVVPPLGTRWGAPLSGFLASPLAELAVDRVAPMLYTSLFEGYGRGLVRRDDARVLLHRLAVDTRAASGPRAAACLGAVGAGAIGDERTYRSVHELEDDVSLVRAAGVDDIALFDLGGVLANPPVERWLDALVATEPSELPAPRALFGELVLGALRVASFAARGVRVGGR